MSPEPTRRSRLPWLTLLGVGLALAAAFAPESARLAYQFDRDAIRAREVWRALSGHLLHWTPEHLTWNVAAFAVLGAFLERQSRRAFALLVAGSALIISTALFVGAPSLQFYRGLSGVDTALFTAVALGLLRRAHAAGSKLGVTSIAILLAALVAKLAMEFTTGATVFTDTHDAFRVVPLAHLAGAATAVLGLAFTRIKPRPEPAAA